jgi:aminoglycoside phosphotransferase (APT) family kinase protein
MTAITALLAHDPQLPYRDLLLDPEVAGRRLALRLRSGWAVDVSGCELVRVKYRVGESLRAVYRLRVDGDEQLVAARMFTGGAGAEVYRKAAARAVPSRSLRPVARDAELDTVIWTFPNDRKLEHLTALDVVPDGLRDRLPRRWEHSRLVAYAPEKSATARCLDKAGETIAYVKAYARPEAERHARVLDTAREHPLTRGRVRVPAVLGRSEPYRMLWLEAIEGRQLGELRGTELTQGLEWFGAALATLHGLPAAGLAPFARLELPRLRVAAEVIGRARPELAGMAARLAEHLAATRPPEGEAVHLHGDVHPRNVLVDQGRLALIDLDQAGAGQPAADLGSVLARIGQDLELGLLDPAGAAETGGRFLRAYAAVRPLPGRASLRWHTAAALLAERALRAVNRVIPVTLPHLGALLTQAAELTAARDDQLVEVSR